MKFIRRSDRQHPKVSIVLLDWSVRESFHLLHYLRQQAIPREQFEVVLIEYYSRVSPAAQRFSTDIDTWALIEMPEECYYHKHLMYNVGIALSRGEICVFCDSDAMVEPTFVGAILAEFEKDPDIVLHLDQFRNMRRDLYPFSFPSFQDVLGPGCINNVNGKTRGLADTEDPLHERNYGACMCARRADLITIGGADEHLDYLGHICGPYDMTFRLVNLGRRELWHESEFMCHTWHPGQAGVANYLGPHDGRHMSTTALDALATGRVQPLDSNPGIVYLRQNVQVNEAIETLLPRLLPGSRAHQWITADLPGGARSSVPRTALYRGYRIEPHEQAFIGRLLVSDFLGPSLCEPVGGDTERAVRDRIDRELDRRLKFVSAGASAYALAWRALVVLRILTARALNLFRTIPRRLKRIGDRALGQLRDGLVLRRMWQAIRTLTRSIRTGAFYDHVQYRVRSAWSRTSDLWSRFFMERRVFAGSLGSLLVNLYFLGRLRDSAAPRPIVIVDRPAVSQYLRTLFAFRLLPPVDIIHVTSGADLDRWISTLSETGWQGHVMVDRDLYMRHYGILSKLRHSRRLVVA